MPRCLLCPAASTGQAPGSRSECARDQCESLTGLKTNEGLGAGLLLLARLPGPDPRRRRGVLATERKLAWKGRHVGILGSFCEPDEGVQQGRRPWPPAPASSPTNGPVSRDMSLKFETALETKRLDPSSVCGGCGWDGISARESDLSGTDLPSPRQVRTLATGCPFAQPRGHASPHCSPRGASARDPGQK